jgi:hypothetical protein
MLYGLDYTAARPIRPAAWGHSTVAHHPQSTMADTAHDCDMAPTEQIRFDIH